MLCWCCWLSLFSNSSLVAITVCCAVLQFISFAYKFTKLNHSKWREWFDSVPFALFAVCVRVNGTMRNLLFLTFSIAMHYMRWDYNVIFVKHNTYDIHANVSASNAIIITNSERKRQRFCMLTERTTWENEVSEIEQRERKRRSDLHSR